VNLLLHKRFATSSEKYRHPGQHELFDEAQKVQGKVKTGKACFALKEIRKSYAIGRQIKEKRAAEKRSIHRASAGPMLDKLRYWCQQSLLRYLLR